MKTAIYLRIAALLTLIHATLHTIGGVFGKPSPGAAATVFDTMQSHHFPILGATRSYADFYFGYGMGLTILMTVLAILVWQLSILAKQHTTNIRPIIFILMLGWIAFAINSYLYFFSAPVIAELLIAAFLGFSLLVWDKRPVA